MAVSALLAIALPPLLVSGPVRGREESLFIRGFAEVSAVLSYPHNSKPCALWGACFCIMGSADVNQWPRPHLPCSMFLLTLAVR